MLGCPAVLEHVVRRQRGRRRRGITVAHAKRDVILWQASQASICGGYPMWNESRCRPREFSKHRGRQKTSIRLLATVACNANCTQDSSIARAFITYSVLSRRALYHQHIGVQGAPSFTSPAPGPASSPFTRIGMPLSDIRSTYCRLPSELHLSVQSSWGCSC